jgi:hypothetical protein
MKRANIGAVLDFDLCELLLSSGTYVQSFGSKLPC